MGASLPTRNKARFSAMETSQFTFNKKFKVMPSTGKVTLTVLWDSQGVLLVHFQKRSENVNSASYCEVLSKLQDAIHRKRPGPLARGVLLHHDNARPDTATATHETIQELQRELLEHPPYSPDFVPSDSNPFGPLKSHLGGKRFADEVVETEVQKWLRQQSNDFYTAGFDARVKRRDKCISVGGEYVDKQMFSFQPRISHVLRFISICEPFTDSPSQL
jgi:histone-lysine N-methyltransferase SETMAR